MKFFLFLISTGLSISLFGGELTPCQLVGFDKVADNTVSSGGIYLSPLNRKKIIIILKKCIKDYSVCIVRDPVKGEQWYNKKLEIPLSNNGFDPTSSDLIFGLLQYVDKKTGFKVCIATSNSFANAVPWVGESWIIGKNGDVTEYELTGTLFNTVMTPKSLYKAMMASHKDELDRASRLIDFEQKMEQAKRLLDEGYTLHETAGITGLLVMQIIHLKIK